MIRCRTDQETAIAFLTRLLFAIYFIETGLLLIVGPWTEWWSRNLFAQLLPWLQLVMAFSLTRLAVNMLGLVTAFAGLSEIWLLLVRRPYRRASSQS